MLDLDFMKNKVNTHKRELNKRSRQIEKYANRENQGDKDKARQTTLRCIFEPQKEAYPLPNDQGASIIFTVIQWVATSTLISVLISSY